MKIAIIGGGITGISAARILSGRANVVVFEKNDKIGGLIRCDQLNEGLYHKLGGHVFNTKSLIVHEWFWSHFDKSEFIQLNRNARILFDEGLVGYPIENHLYQLSALDVSRIVMDLLTNREKVTGMSGGNFKEALLTIFGATLCEKYFFPYNEKIWRTDLSRIPTDWLEGKLPMPKLSEIFASNIMRKPESEMVHSKFYYPKVGGSQFVIDRLAKGLSVRLNTPVNKIARNSNARWEINGDTTESFDWVLITDDIRSLDRLVPAVAGQNAYKAVKLLRTRGITNVFCECDKTDVSWLYIPDRKYTANRIIYTGGFSLENNRTARMTCVVEFVHGELDSNIECDLASLPGNLRRIAINHVRDAYVIQDTGTRENVSILRTWCEDQNLGLIGRFAEWEYYNIDKCIESAMKIANKI